MAILYGVTVLADLPSIMNVSNIYNADASSYIIDMETGDFIMDTWHESPGNLIRRVLWMVAAFIAVTLISYYVWVRNNAEETMKRVVEKAVLEEKLQKAEAAEKAKTMFLSNMSHDIRTPMNAIIGFTTLAQANINNTERVQEYFGKILSSGNHLLSLINDVLDMSRIERGRLNIDVIDEEIYCDKLHINQVLLNLLSNAIKFTPAGGRFPLLFRKSPVYRKAMVLMRFV